MSTLFVPEVLKPLSYGLTLRAICYAFHSLKTSCDKRYRHISSIKRVLAACLPFPEPLASSGDAQTQQPARL